MKTFRSVINVNLTSLTTDEPMVDVPCGSCTLCCEKLSPYLTVEEIQSGAYPISLVNPNDPSDPEAGPVIALYRKVSGGCGMLIDGKCSIYDTRPKACRQFDCRRGHHPIIPNMVDR